MRKTYQMSEVQNTDTMTLKDGVDSASSILVMKPRLFGFWQASKDFLDLTNRDWSLTKASRLDYDSEAASLACSWIMR